MNSILRTECGRLVLEVFYDAEACDWDAEIQKSLILHGLRPGQAKIIATPRRYLREAST